MIADARQIELREKMVRLGKSMVDEWDAIGGNRSGVAWKAGGTFLWMLPATFADKSLPDVGLTVSVWTPKSERGKGHAKAALIRLKELADEHAVPLFAVVHPFEMMNGQGGRAWVEADGFTHVYREPERQTRTEKMRRLLTEVGFVPIHHSILNVEDRECRNHCFTTVPEGMDYELSMALIEAKVKLQLESSDAVPVRD